MTVAAWGSVYNRKLALGHDHGSAAYAADQWEKGRFGNQESLMTDHIFRVRFTIAGGHVHCALYSRRAGSSTFELLGEFRAARGLEFRDLVAAFSKADFVGETEELGIAAACEGL